MLLFHLISPLLGSPAISILLQSIVNHYLYNSYCLTIVSEEPIDFTLNLTFTYIIPNRTDKELTAQLFVVSENGCSDYVVNMRDPRRFMTAFDVVSKSGNIRRSDRKIIIIAHPEGSNNQTLDLLFMKETSFVANLLIIIPNEEAESPCEVFDVVTHKFGGSEDGYTDQPMYLDQWNSCTRKFKTNSNLFPHDMTNLNGKRVKIATFTYKPYVLLDLDPAIAPKGRDGLEIRIAEEFCRWVNCTIEIVREDKDQWGEIYETGKGIGVMGSVAEDRADMGVAALYSWFEIFQYLDFSAATIRAAVTCVAPSPRLLASWETPLMPFSWFMRCAVLITFLFASIGLIVAKRCSTDGVFLTVLGVMTSQSQKDANSTWRVRSVTGWLLIAGLVLVSAYGGGLASTFTVPKYEPSIDTVQDLVDRNMEWGATHDAWIFSLTLSNEPLVKTLVSQFRVYPGEELKIKSFTRSMAFGIERLPGGYFAIGDYLTKEALLDLTIMQQDFYSGQCVIMMRKSSPYTKKMSLLVGKLHQSGLLIAWETQVALKHLNFEVQQEVKLSRLKGTVGITKPLSMRDVVGIFTLYVNGISLSMLMFLGERLTKKIKSERRR